MRWSGSRFALFAVAVVAAGVLFGAPARAVDPVPVDTDTILLWRGQAGQPTGRTTFYVSVTSKSGTARPTGSVVINPDNSPAVTLNLTKDDPDDAQGKITDDFVLDLGIAPHYFVTKYQPTADSVFTASGDELGMAVATMDAASPEPSQDGQAVTYTFVVGIWPGSPKKPTGKVAFNDDDGHTSSPNDPSLGNDLKASWIVAQRGQPNQISNWTTTANYPGDDIYLPLRASRAHNVNPPAPGTKAVTTTTRKPTATTARSTATTRRTGSGTAVLAPINPTTTTTPSQGTTTSVTFGSFPTSPPITSGLASGTSGQNNNGPPIVVVVGTLLALGVLGGIAAFRRYRHNVVDWF